MPKGHKRVGENLRTEIHVDDPAIVARGTLKQRDGCSAIVVLIWRTLGFFFPYSRQETEVIKYRYTGLLLRILRFGRGGVMNIRPLFFG